ncbi:CheY-like chemotaxis protein [Phenylobacterium haematophilum]|uniref:CheY-like chemotaxis protein n=1 Tax=Phenylobacterium haematophilum TaxID=98513 RepID=A0A840A2S0_9CAUL|nr:response regulator [Phenylobacterium haematophilum]MBB3892926.1 CheY-like chemotaxis protein [Phenylobacterium haematophilum]
MGREVVLVVEDDPACRDLISEILADVGYDCLQADGGRAAIALMARRPDVLLTDLLMSDKDGVEVIMEVRRRWPSTRIVAMSGGFGIFEASQLLRTANFAGRVSRRAPGARRSRGAVDESRRRHAASRNTHHIDRPRRQESRRSTPWRPILSRA